MSLLHRKDGGQPLRNAMSSADLSIPALARATKHVDPTEKGVSQALVGRLVAQGSSARERCRLRTAWLIAVALDEPLQDLFSMPTRSTFTEERSTPDGDEDPTRAR